MGTSCQALRVKLPISWDLSILNGKYEILKLSKETAFKLRQVDKGREDL